MPVHVRGTRGRGLCCSVDAAHLCEREEDVRYREGRQRCPRVLHAAYEVLHHLELVLREVVQAADAGFLREPQARRNERKGYDRKASCLQWVS